MGRVILFVTAPAARESASPRAAPTDPGPRTGAHTRYWAKHLSPATRGVARHYILRALRVHRDEESSSSERFVFSRVEMGGSRFLEIREALCQNSAPGRGWRSQTTLPPPTSTSCICLNFFTFKHWTRKSCHTKIQIPIGVSKPTSNRNSSPAALLWYGWNCNNPF